VLVGGEGRPEGLEDGFYVKPTIFVDVTNDMTIAQEEIFGPVLSVLTYKDEEGAVAMANDTSYGLFGWVSSSDPERGKRIADRIEAGGVFVNDMFDPFDIAEASFGGYKQSGLGTELGVYGIEEYLQTQSIFVNAS
jgi:aldehyde dehydrogenase (NAD+)